MSEIHSYLRRVKPKYLPVRNKTEIWVHETYITNKGIIFPDSPKVGDIIFEPIASPEEMIKSGIFGGLYFGSGKPDSKCPNALAAFNKLPKSWFENVYMSETKPNWKGNKFGVSAGLNAQWWNDRLLIDEVDKLGWFQWYCMFWLGRRIPEIDKRQIMRWFSYSTRHSQMALANPSGVSDKYRQSLWQWSVNPYPDKAHEFKSY